MGKVWEKYEKSMGKFTTCSFQENKVWEFSLRLSKDEIFHYELVQKYVPPNALALRYREYCEEYS